MFGGKDNSWSGLGTPKAIYTSTSLLWVPPFRGLVGFVNIQTQLVCWVCEQTFYDEVNNIKLNGKLCYFVLWVGNDLPLFCRGTSCPSSRNFYRIAVASIYWVIPHESYYYSGCPVYLSYMHSTFCEMLSWMSYKLESRLLGEVSRYVDDTTLMAEREEELKSLDDGEGGEWKSRLKTQY